MKRALAVAFSIALLLACSREEPAVPQTLPQSPAPVAAGPVVAFLGDSITAGYELRAEQAYPALVQAELAKQDKPFKLINAGVSGDTTAGGLRRVDWLLAQKPAVVVIELGGNDGLRGAPVAETEKNLRAIVDKVRTAGATPLLLGMRLPPSFGEPYVTEFAGVYERLAKEMSLPYVPFFMQGVAGMVDLTQEDGLHPTAQGHVKLAATVAPALAPLITRERSR